MVQDLKEKWKQRKSDINSQVIDFKNQGVTLDIERTQLESQKRSLRQKSEIRIDPSCHSGLTQNLKTDLAKNEGLLESSKKEQKDL